jgi:diguanylate cyclase (GGDEF)-like protein
LANRRLLTELLDADLARTERDGLPLAVAFLDLDGFKNVNDTHGHDAGDLVLCETARRLLTIFRKADTVARVGGDEFVVLCPQVQGEAEVRLIADRLLQATREPILIDGRALAITVSAGMALAEADDVAASLLQRSDHAMLSAKRQGRGISVLAGPETEAPDEPTLLTPGQGGPVPAVAGPVGALP